MKSIFAIVLSSALVLSLFGCAPLSSGGAGKPHPSVAGISDRFTLEEEKIAVFTEGDSPSFYASKNYSNNGVFNCTWRDWCIQFSDGVMSMSVCREENGGFAGAEYRSYYNSYGYGFYSVSMKAAACSGVISSFFTYTNRGGWDEIDIEFLGKDTTGIQLNYYTKGVGGHEFWYDLGFDGSEDFHEYAFDWQPDSLTWYVDGKPIYRATENIPTRPTQIMANVWNCKGVDEWSGPFDESKLPATAQYQWIGFSAA